MSDNSIFLTGFNGFLGRSLLNNLSNRKIICYGRSRNEGPFDCFVEGDLENLNSYIESLSSIEVVVHCAARVHVMDDDSSNPLKEFRTVNTTGTLNLAQQAAEAGVKRFIFISSIKVNGESTVKGRKFTSDDEPSPEDPYAISKAEAEKGLLEIAKETGMEVVIIRPPLVYGAGVKGNFLSLLKLSKLPIPLPFGLINNKRSMVYLDNLVDLIITCIDHPKAANKVFLASDNDDLSLSILLKLIRQAMNRRSLLLPVPSFLFQLIGKLLGKSAVIDRLLGNLQVDSSDASRLLSWTPPYSVEEGVKATVDEFLRSANKNFNKKV